jgi:hypothetical protein
MLPEKGRECRRRGRLGFRDISRFTTMIISLTKKDKNPDFIPLESPCDSEQNKPSPDF